MTALTPAEQLLYSSVRLTAYSNDVSIQNGTGFFVALALNGNRFIPVIVTNKHVLLGANKVRAICHIAADVGGEPSGKFCNCDLTINDENVIYHPDPQIDLCAISFGGILAEAVQAGTPIFQRPIGLNLIPTAEEWDNFDALENVIMIGCPNGIMDEVNNFPIARQGITATPLSVRYAGRDEFMIDMACFPGSSGSPIFIFDRIGHFDKKKASYMMGQGRLKLAGILYAGPQINNNGQIILAKPPSVLVPSMMHLGYAIRSSALLDLDKIATERLLAEDARASRINEPAPAVPT